MTDFPIQQHLHISGSSDGANPENFVLRPILANESASDSCLASDLYAQAGVRRGDTVVDCIAAGSTAYREMEASHHALIRALLFVCWDLSKRATENDGEWSLICELRRWERRHIKPKLSDDEGKRCRFIAYLIFSNETDCGDDGASKKGRAVEYLIRKKFDEAEVIDELRQPGGIDRIYKLAVSEFPRSLPPQRRSDQSAKPFRVVTIRKKGSSSAFDHLAAQERKQVAISTKSNFNASESNASILFAPGPDERAVFLELNKGDKLVATIECAARDGDRVVLTASNIRLRSDAS